MRAKLNQGARTKHVNNVLQVFLRAEFAFCLYETVIFLLPALMIFIYTGVFYEQHLNVPLRSRW